MKRKAIAVVTFLTIALSCVGCGKEEPIPTNDSVQSSNTVYYTQKDIEDAFVQAHVNEVQSNLNNSDYTEVCIEDSSTKKIVRVNVPNKYIKNAESVQDSTESIESTKSIVSDYNGLEDSIKIVIASSIYNYDRGQSAEQDIERMCSSTSYKVLVPMQTASGATCVLKSNSTDKVTAYRYIDCAKDGYYVMLMCKANSKCYVDEKELLDILYEIKLIYESQ
ncbi:MAG: hypothetical protein J6A94_10385 [Lachnospiraceae bacterium]|nr:hypothetical protein [Lachnospiraceae bacterium]